MMLTSVINVGVEAIMSQRRNVDDIKCVDEQHFMADESRAKARITVTRARHDIIV